MSLIEGQKGGKKGAGGMPDDTLKSHAYLQLIDAVSEGPIESIDEILINRTPIANITNAQHQIRMGLPDDQPLEGFNSTESFVSIGTDVGYEVGAITRTITDQTLDAVKIYMVVNVIYRLDSKGALKTADTGWRIDLKPAGGVWTEVVTQDLDGQKATSPVQFEHRIALTGQGPWDIRVRPRFTAKRDKHEERLQWVGYANVVDAKQTYPHTAHVGMTFSAEHVGSSMPTRHYRGKWRKILVPTNYNPITRVYTGTWDGTFKRAWSNCPPWVLYDMAENNVFGIGDHIDITTVNKWRLYTIAQYCDQLVPSGYRNAAGVMQMEPRYTFNGAITDKKQALDAFRSITAVWRGMGFYGLSQLYTTVDMPQDPAFIYGPSNVVEGRFEYSSSSVKARHSVVLVRFNDPNNLFEPAIEPVIDDEAVAQPHIGWRETTLELAGCSSRSLAHRYGKWVIETEKSETETVNFAVSLDSIHALPGEVIAISDPRRVNARLTGRVVSRTGTGATITLDKPVPADITGTVTLRVQNSDGSLLTVTGTVATNRANITVPTAQRPGVIASVRENAVYILSSAQVTPKLYRIISIEEEPSAGAESVLFRINALQYNPTKFARVEQGIEFDPIPTTLPLPNAVPPTDFVAETRAYTDGGQIRNDIEVKWKPPVGTLVREYRVAVTTPSMATIQLATTAQNSITYSTSEPGLYQFKIVAVSFIGGFSDPLYGNFTVEGLSSMGVGAVTDLVNAATLLGGTTTFSDRDVRLSWRNMMPVSSVAGIAEVDSDDATYAYTSLEFYFGATKVRTQRVKGNSFIYTLDMNKADAIAMGLTTAQRQFTVRAALVDKNNRVSPQTSIVLTNNAPQAITPTVSAEGNFLNITWPASTDDDAVGYLVWVRTTNGSVVGVNPTAETMTNNYRFQGAYTTGYYVTVVGYDAFGPNSLNYATPLLTSTSANPTDTTAPATPTGLALSSSITSTGAKLVATWTANLEADMLGYEVTIREGTGGDLSFTTPSNRHEWAVTSGLTYTVKVRALDKNNNRSNYTAEATHVAAKDTVAPATPVGVAVTAGFNAIWLSWTANAEADMAFYEVAEGDATFTTAAATVAYSSLSSTVARTGLGDGVQKFFRVRAVDTSGNRSGWSAIVNATTTSLDLNTGAPPVPAGLAASSVLGGLGDASTTATWTAAAGAVSYELGVTVAGGNEVTQYSGLTSLTFGSLAGVSLSLRVRSVGQTGKKSAWSAAVAVTAAVDAVAPAVPTGLVATGGFETIWLKLNRNSEADFSYYEFYESATTTAPAVGAAPSFISPADSLVRSGLTGAAVTRYYWVRAVDTSGNKSAWSARVTATTTVIDTSITTEKLAGLINATSFASGLATIEILPTLPASGNFEGRQVFLTTDKKLYRHKGTPTTAAGFTNEVDGADLVLNSVTTGAIAAGAVKTAQLDAFAVTASKMLIGDTSNIINDPDCVDLAAWSLVSGGGVLSVAVTTSNIASRNQVNASVSTDTQVIASSIFPVEPGKPLWVSAFLGRGTGDTVAQEYELAVEFFSNAGGTVSIGEISVAVVTTASYAIRSGQITAPATGRRARLIARKTASAGASIGMRLGAPIVRRAANGELIVDGAITAIHVGANEVITNSANIKDAVITNAKIVDLSAAKLIAGTALAGSITVSSRALSAINTDAALGAQDPTTRINAGLTTIDPGKIVISGATMLSDWRGSTDTTTINGGKLETDSISARSIKVGLLQNLVQNGDFSDTSITAPNYWVSSAGSIVWDTVETYMGSASLRATKTAPDSAHAIYSNPAKLFSVVPGETLSLSAVVKSNAAAAIGFYVRLNWYDAAGAVLTATPYSGLSENKPHTTDWVTHEWQRVVPVGAAYAGVRFINGSTQTTATILYIGRIFVRRATGTVEIEDGAITGAKLITTENVITLGAQIKDAVITDGHVTNLSATKLIAGSALAATITVSGTALSSIRSDAQTGAQDPVTRINGGTTQIDPGKIVISGATTLADWRSGTDSTKIEGGNLATNSVAANKLEIGSRNLTVTGIQFDYNAPTANRVAWSAGVIRYINDAGTPVNASITANAAGTLWTSGVLFIYWVKGATSLSTTTTQATAFGANNVIIATYGGGADLVTDFGKTIIDGGTLKTGSVKAAQLDVTTAVITGTAQIADAIITTAKIADAQITSAKIGDAAITNAKISGAIQSTDFVAGAAGAGWRADKNGVIEANDIIIRRQIEVASGTITVGNFTPSADGGGADSDLNAGWALSGKTIFARSTPIGLAAWQGVKKTYLVTVGMSGSVNTSSSPDTYWGWTGEVLPLTKWSGDQSLRLKLDFWSRNVNNVSGCVVTWKIYEVS